MSITQGACNSFKSELLQSIHDFDVDTFKLALYTSSASLDATTTAYTTTGEASGTGYTAGGETLTGGVVTLNSGKGIVDFDNAQWTTSTFTARGGLIYNSSKSNRSVAVIDFGGNQSPSAGTLDVIFPDASASSAIIRISG